MRAIAFLAVALITTAAPAQEPGWHYSPLPGEGDRASLGCSRDSTSADFLCLAVRCEDDFSTGMHVYASRRETAGNWQMTIDRVDKVLAAEPAPGPYGARFIADADWLLESLREGSFVYLRHEDDAASPFRFIDLTGSLYRINEALAFCAPRAPN